MAGSRRLSELLQEQQEPFLLLLNGAATDAAAPCCSKNAHAAAEMRSALGRSVSRVVRLAGCFLRRLPRAGNTGGSHCEDGEEDGGRRLSPVSVLDVLRYYSDEESNSSPALSHWEEEDPSSTSGSSPPFDLQNDLLAAGATSAPSVPHTADDWTRTRSAEQATTTGSRKKSVEEEQKIIDSWQRIAGDIARVPALAELDLYSAGSTPEWQRWLGLVEAEQVGASIEAMIFEEVREEAVCDIASIPVVNTFFFPWVLVIPLRIS